MPSKSKKAPADKATPKEKDVIIGYRTDGTAVTKAELDSKFPPVKSLKAAPSISPGRVWNEDDPEDAAERARQWKEFMGDPPKNATTRPRPARKKYEPTMQEVIALAARWLPSIDCAGGAIAPHSKSMLAIRSERRDDGTTALRQSAWDEIVNHALSRAREVYRIASGEASPALEEAEASFDVINNNARAEMQWLDEAARKGKDRTTLGDVLRKAMPKRRAETRLYYWTQYLKESKTTGVLNGIDGEGQTIPRGAWPIVARFKHALKVRGPEWAKMAESDGGERGGETSAAARKVKGAKARAKENRKVRGTTAAKVSQRDAGKLTKAASGA